MIGVAYLFLLMGLIGCGDPLDEFQPNLVFMGNQKLVENIEDFDLPEVQQHTSDITDAVGLLFGTADSPRIPDIDGLPERFDLDLLEIAAGPQRTNSDGKTLGLFRQHCASCHGVTGNGLGPLAATLNPYPRDYRRGIFKFKTTPSTLPPTRDDLRAVLVRGVSGTEMPTFKSLKDSQRDALVEYVRYLSVRGMFERAVISEVAMELDFDERLIDLSLRDEAPHAFAEQEQLLFEIAESVVEPWLDSEQSKSSIPPQPPNWAADESIAFGRQLFFLTITNCAECHGNLALGDGITDDYDEWTKELDPENPAILDDYLTLGALPPRHSIPRNLREGIYRGGSSPEIQFLRIRNGIAGTTMPSIAAQFGDDEIWHLVAYVRSLHSNTVADEPLPTATAIGNTN